MHEIGRSLISQWVQLSLRAQVALAFLGVVYLVLIVSAIRLGSHGILEYLSGFALFFSHSSLGPPILVTIITICSFPPMVGYGTAITLCGLAFGSPLSGPGHGLGIAWLIASIGCVAGSLASFLGCRWALRNYANEWEWVKKVRRAREWRAMEKAVDSKGWKMIMLVRVSGRANEQASSCESP